MGRIAILFLSLLLHTAHTAFSDDGGGGSGDGGECRIIAAIDGPGLSRAPMMQRYFRIRLDEFCSQSAEDESTATTPVWVPGNNCDGAMRMYGVSVNISFFHHMPDDVVVTEKQMRFETYCLAIPGHIRVWFREPRLRSGLDHITQVVQVLVSGKDAVSSPSVAEGLVPWDCNCGGSSSSSSNDGGGSSSSNDGGGSSSSSNGGGGACADAERVSTPGGEVMTALSWREAMQCKHREKQIDLDMQRWPSVSREQFDHSLREGAHQVHYAIIGNKLYSRVIGTVVEIRTYIEPFFLALCRHVQIPDVEFVINFSDYPMSNKRKHRDTDTLTPTPVFSMCTTSDFDDIHLPTYDMMISAIGRKYDMVAPCRDASVHWDRRKNEIVWRGSDSNRNRFAFALKAQELNKTHGFFDVGVAHMIRIKRILEEHGEPVEPIGFCNFFDYKVVATVDGSVAAYRMPFLMFGGSVVLKQDSPYTEHFYSELVPYEHYVPFAADNSDLGERGEWIMANIDKARVIARNSLQFAHDRLAPPDIFCYVHTLLTEFASRLQFTPSSEGMELMPQPRSSCPCRE